MARADFALFLMVAAGLHAGALAVLEPRLCCAAEAAGTAPLRVRAADSDLAALIAAWNTPPEVGAASELLAPGAEAPPPDTAAAAAAESAVAAEAILAALGPASGPGKAAVKPIFAPPPSTSTAPPPTLSLRAPEPEGPTLALADPGRSDAGAGAGGFGALPAVPALGRGDMGRSLALPDAPPVLEDEDEDAEAEAEADGVAPAAAPFPRPRPDAAALAALPPSDLPELEASGAIEDDDAAGDGTAEGPSAPHLVPGDFGAAAGGFGAAGGFAPAALPGLPLLLLPEEEPEEETPG